MDSTGVLSWILHHDINSLNGAGTHFGVFKRSCKVLMVFSRSFGTDFNGAGHKYKIFFFWIEYVNGRLQIRSCTKSEQGLV